MVELNLSPRVNVVRYLALSQGKSGSSWLARFLTMHGCAFDAYECPCPVLHTELASLQLSLEPGSFFTKRTKKILNLNDNATGSETIDMKVYPVAPVANWNRTDVGFGVDRYVEESLRSTQRRSEVDSRCTSFAYGGKCPFLFGEMCPFHIRRRFGGKCPVRFGEMILNDEAQQRLRALLASSSPPVRLINLVRRNVLEHKLADPGYFREHPGQIPVHSRRKVAPPQVVDVPRLVHALNSTLNSNSGINMILRNVAASAGAPFIEVVYEDLCASPHALNELFGFLSLPPLSEEKLLSIERSLPHKNNMNLLRERISNYEDLKTALESASLGHLLCIEECTLGIRFGVAPRAKDGMRR
jgi:hypothetical protein